MFRTQECTLVCLLVAKNVIIKLQRNKNRLCEPPQPHYDQKYMYVYKRTKELMIKSSYTHYCSTNASKHNSIDINKNQKLYGIDRSMWKAMYTNRNDYSWFTWKHNHNHQTHLHSTRIYAMIIFGIHGIIFNEFIYFICFFVREKTKYENEIYCFLICIVCRLPLQSFLYQYHPPRVNLFKMPWNYSLFRRVCVQVWNAIEELPKNPITNNMTKIK